MRQLHKSKDLDPPKPEREANSESLGGRADNQEIQKTKSLHNLWQSEHDSIVIRTCHNKCGSGPIRAIGGGREKRQQDFDDSATILAIGKREHVENLRKTQHLCREFDDSATVLAMEEIEQMEHIMKN